MADSIALVPSRGGDSPDRDRALDRSLSASLLALGHTLAPSDAVAQAAASLPAGAPTPESLRALGASLGVDWVVLATEAEAVSTIRVELGASLVAAGRYESVAREVDRDAEDAQVREMAQVLLKKEGVGTGALPWESLGPKRPTKPADGTSSTTVKGPGATPPPAPEGPTHLSFLADEADVETPYSADRPFFFGVGLGFDVLAARPANARGNPAAMVGTFRIGGAIPSTGLELFAELGGHLVNAPSVWFGGGARYMFSPLVSDKKGFALHLGPSARFDGYARLGSTAKVGDTELSTATEVAPSVVGSFELALGVTPLLQLDLHAGEVRWVGLDSGDLLSVGADVGASMRF
jgi:hypothetical protein